ncbi:Fe-S oxidoreductase [Aureimonas sp. Leaf454]|uniref:YkgJ family cysteine cluster protein n=1 Tax=Aureimonas sp. Leaf454 TaxID=1736381 RepID=UPI0006FCF7F2|nr:YkgJ family cysteine cluster protein [Aureimonas sp. Leaf454]KQT42957.1 Fe-S oxidoreductase [Aureimonas sp. Leaf454]
MDQAGFDCRTCGACCATSADWPRFSLEPDEQLDRIPEALVKADLSGMRCEGDRCLALSGTIGEAAACTIYALRPEVCRECQPGDPECDLARATHGMAPLSEAEIASGRS